MKERDLDYSERKLLDVTQSVELSLLMLPRDEALDYPGYLVSVSDYLLMQAEAVKIALNEGKTLEEALGDTVLHNLSLHLK